MALRPSADVVDEREQEVLANVRHGGLGQFAGSDDAGQVPLEQGDSYFLGVPVGTLYYWRCRGEGPQACKLGRHLRYRAEDVRAWVASQTGRVA